MLRATRRVVFGLDGISLPARTKTRAKTARQSVQMKRVPMFETI